MNLCQVLGGQKLSGPAWWSFLSANSPGLGSHFIDEEAEAWSSWRVKVSQLAGGRAGFGSPVRTQGTPWIFHEHKYLAGKHVS